MDLLYPARNKATDRIAIQTINSYTIGENNVNSKQLQLLYQRDITPGIQEMLTKLATLSQ